MALSKSIEDSFKKSFTYDDTSKVWVQPLSVILNCMLPVEYIYGDWYMWTAQVEVHHSQNPEHLFGTSSNTIEIGSRIEGFCIPTFLVMATSDDDPDVILDLNEENQWQPDLDSMELHDYLFENEQQERVPIFTVDHAKDDPRYVQLRLTEEWKELRPNYKHSTFLHHSFVIPSGRVLNTFVQAMNSLEQPEREWTCEMHGPVRKLESEGPGVYCEEDKTGVFKFPQAWPEPAMEWLVRTRNGSWPPPELVQEVLESGCHIAPVGRGRRLQEPIEKLDYTIDPSQASTSKEFQNIPDELAMNETEWRLSFSVAEIKLGQSVTPVQRHVLVFLKMLKKMYFPEVVSSYLLKNLLFWEIEKQDESFWKEDNSANCVVYLLKRLVQCLEDRCLPHYILPESNLLQYEDPQKLTEEAVTVRDVIESILLKSIDMLKRMISNNYQSPLFLKDLDLAPFVPRLQDNTLSNDVVQELIWSLYSLFIARYKHSLGRMMELLSRREKIPNKNVENYFRVTANVYQSLLARSLTKKWFLKHELSNSSSNFTLFLREETASLSLDEEFFRLSLMFYEEAQKGKNLAASVPNAIELSKKLKMVIEQEQFMKFSTDFIKSAGLQGITKSDIEAAKKIAIEALSMAEGQGIPNNITIEDIEAEQDEQIQLLFALSQMQL